MQLSNQVFFSKECHSFKLLYSPIPSASMRYCLVQTCVDVFIYVWNCIFPHEVKQALTTNAPEIRGQWKKKGFSIYSKITRNWPEMSCLLPKGNTSLVASKKGRFNHRLQDLNICKFQTTTRRMKAVCEYIPNWFYYYVLAISRSFTLPLTFGRCSYDSGSTRGKE